MDLDNIKQSFRQYRLKLQSIYEKKAPENNLIEFEYPDCWCPKCLDYFDHSLSSHNKKVLSIIGGLFTKQILYGCVECPSHMFYISSMRKRAFQKQYKIGEYKCPHCRKDLKEAERAKAQQEEQERNRIESEQQRILFEKTMMDLEREAQELERQ
jgi:Zn finger protein HypA/HybF involved in hydrogenase expression